MRENVSNERAESSIYKYNDSGRNIANSSFIVDASRTRRGGLDAELQIDWIEGVPGALRIEINIVFLMLGIIVRVELYEGCAGGVPSVVTAALTLTLKRWRMRLCDKRTNANVKENYNLHFKYTWPLAKDPRVLTIVLMKLETLLSPNKTLDCKILKRHLNVLRYTSFWDICTIKITHIASFAILE